MLIDSSNGWFRATLDEEDDGISVVFWRNRSRSNQHWQPLYSTVLDVPWHVARDRVHDLVNELTPDAKAWPERLRVLSVDGETR